TLVLRRAATEVQLRTPAKLAAYLDGVFRAMWVEPRNLNDPSEVASAWRAAGFDPDATLALANETETKAALRSTTDEAIARGVFGAPTMFVGDRMYFGQDRLDFVREALS